MNEPDFFKSFHNLSAYIEIIDMQRGSKGTELSLFSLYIVRNT